MPRHETRRQAEQLPLSLPGCRNPSDCLSWRSVAHQVADLLAHHAEWKAVQSAGVLAARPGAFPPAKGLVSRPGTGRGAQGTIHAGETPLNVFETSGCLGVIAVETDREPIIHVIGNGQRGIQAGNPGQKRDREKHFGFPQPVVERNVGGEDRGTKIPLAEVALFEQFAACQRSSPWASSSRYLWKLA